MAKFLTALDGRGGIVVGRFPILVGRHPRCDARLDSPLVSRLHCTLIEVDGAVLVRDLGSTNGTRINALRVESGWLRPGDELGVASYRFRMTDGPPLPVSTAGFDAATLIPPPSA
jgi:pSer/pThr/pTyr-binding forkhead associated (FHA) protein